VGKIWLQDVSGSRGDDLAEARRRWLEGRFGSLLALHGVEAPLARACAPAAPLRARGASWRRERLLGRAGSPQRRFGGVLAGPGQGLQQVVQQARPEGLVHPLAGEEQVVDLVHALDVPGAVPLLGFQPHLGVGCVGRGEARGAGER